MAVFSYDVSLQGSSKTGTIRLIDLHPGKDQSSLSCELRNASLLSLPTYDALSYCWGGQTLSKTIVCNGKSLAITENLFDALYHFRDSVKVTTLWADAICINQDDLEEKNEQVPLMNRIYSQANKVKVWLGLTAEDMTPTADLISRLLTLATTYAEKLKVPLEEVYDFESPVWFQVLDELTTKADLVAQWAPLVRLLQRPWFTRVWVIQEVVLAHERSWLYYGNVILKWSDVALAIHFSMRTGILQISMELDDMEQLVNVHRAAALARTSAYFNQKDNNEGLGMVWLLCANRSAKATDPRDKIYALLSMAKDGKSQASQLFVTPDYRVETSVLYQQVTEKFLERHPKLYILSHGNTLKRRTDRSFNLPSWVIDWDDPEIGDQNATIMLDQEYESGGYSEYDACLVDKWPKSYTIDGKILKLNGFLHDEIVECADLFSRSQFMSAHRDLSFQARSLLLMKGLREAAQLWQLQPGRIYKHTGEHYLDAFIQTVLFGGTLGQPVGALRAVTKSLLRISTLVSLLANSWIGRSPRGIRLGMKLFGFVPVPLDESVNVPELFGLIMPGITNHVVFRTREGYIGVASNQQTQVGDHVALVRGGFMPLLLRPSDGPSFSLVGDAYIHGMMSGECFEPQKCHELCLVRLHTKFTFKAHKVTGKMTSIRAIVNKSGKAEIRNVPYPDLPREDYLIVKPTAWAINPVDYQLTQLEGEESCDGCNVGFDYAGVVVDVGSKVIKDFKKGDRIAGYVTGQNIRRKADGSFADYFAARGDAQIKVPDNISDTDAATQGVALGTMGQSLYRDLQLPWPNQPSKKPFNIFIYGGSTAMGIAGIQLAKLSGGTVIATASPANSDYLKSLGADYIVDYKSKTIVEDVRTLGLGPIQYALDCRPSEESATASANILSKSGGARYAVLEVGFHQIAEETNPSVKGLVTLAFSALGEPWFYDKVYHDASSEDYELQKSFVLVGEQLLAQGKLKAPRTYVNRGGKGLEGLLYGIAEIGADKVSGGKLVYTAE
ncbi:Hps1-dma1 cluster oxidoreductase toxD [Paramyrothecium foliicola]|nr:Hps1-dma1 cluster oxidoreductase toxD [Paramyrothecium foliicola]